MSPQIINDRMLLSTAEACKISGFGRQYIERLLRQGRLEGFKLSRDWLVYEESLQTFLAKPRKPGPKGPRKKPKIDISVIPSPNSDTTTQEKNEEKVDESHAGHI